LTSFNGLRTNTINNQPPSPRWHTEHETRHQSIAIDSNPIARPTPLTRPKFCREKSQENSAKSPQHPTFFYLAITTLSSTNTTLAGVAQSVERVALINSKEINLKVVGSSPTFGYSYHIKLIRAAVLFPFLPDMRLLVRALVEGLGGVGVRWMTVIQLSCFLLPVAKREDGCRRSGSFAGCPID
jgi:hypothetical protein